MIDVVNLLPWPLAWRCCNGLLNVHQSTGTTLTDKREQEHLGRILCSLFIPSSVFAMTQSRPPGNRKFSAARKSSVHREFVFTVEGATPEGWETDVRPVRKKTWDAQNYFAQKIRNRVSAVIPPTPSKPRRSRLLLKNGDYNLVGKNIPERRARFFTDFWNTLIDLHWTIVLLFFLISLVSSWLFFAIIVYLIALAHGDLHPIAGNSTAPTPCVENVKSFASSFLYSIETMHTIGYGSRYPTEECSFTIAIMCLSALVGCALEAFIVGVVFAKFQMPAQRAQTLMFSQNAVISVRDGSLCLFFRIGNMRRSLIINLAVKAHLVHHRMTREAELMPFHQHELSIQLDSISGSAFSTWPVTACHKIDSSSPIYDLSRKSLGQAKFEIIVALEGVVENTGAVVQARTSYTPEEIIWGHMFTRLLTFRREKGEYVVDFDHFQKLEAVKGMTGFSGRELDERKGMSEPEASSQEEECITFSFPSDPIPGLTRAATTGDLQRLQESCARARSYSSGKNASRNANRRPSRLVGESERLREVFRRPDPDLAEATGANSPESIHAIAKVFENSHRKTSRALTDDLVPCAETPCGCDPYVATSDHSPCPYMYMDAIVEDLEEGTKL